MKKRDDENLSKTNMLRVISLLEQEKPITKKAACEILNISYNTTRLGKLITEFKEKEANNKIRRAKLRGTPLTSAELSMIAQSYLNGDPLSAISEFIYRPSKLIKEGLDFLGIPERDASNNYFNPPLLNEKSVKEDYNKDDLVFSARYGEAAFIEERHETSDGPAYAIYVLGKEQCYAFQPFWELSDLTRVQTELNLDLKAQTGMQPSYNPRQ